MATALRPIGHEDRLSLIEHLTELRSRMVISAVVLSISFGICFWQSTALLDLLNRPLHLSGTKTGSGQLTSAGRAAADVRTGINQLTNGLETLAQASRNLTPQQRQSVAAAVQGGRAAAAALPRTQPERRPVTLGVGEPFTTTLGVALAFGVLFALPVLLFQAYAFVLPAFSKTERRVALPLMGMVPVLFTAGVLFAYFLVLPPAIRFLQHYNSDSYDILIQAKDYYKFEILTLVALGTVFQVPVGMLAANRMGLVTAEKLIRGWRYAIVICFVVAAALPGVDPVTTVLEAVPLLLLYVLSIVLVKVFDRAPPETEEVVESDGVDLAQLQDEGHEDEDDR